MKLFNKRGLSFRKQRKKMNLSLVKEIVIWTVEIAIAIGLAAVLVYFLGMRTTVIGQSMKTTLSDADQVLVDRFVFNVRNPRIGEIIVFLPNGNEKTHYYIKRVVAVGGDSVQIKEGVLYVNDEPSTLVTTTIADPGTASERIKLEKDEYFVLGDNLSNSEDSRFSTVGLVKDSYILGKVWYRISGFMNMGFV